MKTTQGCGWVFSAMAILVMALPGQAGTKTWSASATSTAWSLGSNWVEGSAPVDGDDVIVNGDGAYKPTGYNNAAINSLTFTGAFDAAPGSLKIGAGGVSNNCTASYCTLGTTTLLADQTWNSAATKYMIVTAFAGAYKVTFNGYAVRIDGSSPTWSGGLNIRTYALSGGVLGSGTVTPFGTGQITLINQLADGSTLSNPRMSLNGNATDSSLATASILTNLIVLSDPTAGNFTIDQTTDALSGTNHYHILSGNITGAVNTARTLSFNNSHGAAATTPVTFILTGANSYSAQNVVGANATLQIGNAGTSGTLGMGTNTTVTGRLVFKRSDTMVVSNVVSGAGVVEQSGSGTTTLTAPNTYTGPTVISNGTLEVGGAGQLGNGSYAGAITNAASFLWSCTAAQTLIGTISGSGDLTKSGSGALTLATNNTYTGATRVHGGTLTVSGNGALNASSGLIVSNNAAFWHLPATVGTVLTPGGTLNLCDGATIGMSCDATTASVVSVSGAATIGAGAGVKVALSGALTPGTTYTILKAGSGLDTGNYSLTAGSITNCTVVFNKSATAVSITASAATPLSAAYWKGASGTGRQGIWAASDGSADGNWAATAGGSVQPLLPGSGANVYISANSPTVAPTSTTLGANMTVNGLTIQDTTYGLRLNADGYALTLGAGGVTMNAGVPASTLGANIVLGANQAWSNASANALTVSGVISGSGSLTNTGAGKLALANTNTFSGAIVIKGATVELGSSGGLVGTSLINPVAGGTLTCSGVVTVADNGGFAVGSGTAGLGTVNIASGAVVNVGNGTGGKVGRIYVGGLLDNTGSLGTGTLNINGGVLNVAVGGVATVGDGNCLWINPYGNGGTSTINLNGGILSTARSIRDGGAGGSVVNFNGGTLQAKAGIDVLNNAGTYTATINAGGLTVDSQGYAATISKAMGGAGGLTKTGSGSLVLSGANTYTGGTTINAGTLKLGATAGVPSSQAVTITSGVLDLAGYSPSVSTVTLAGGMITNSGAAAALTGTAFAVQSGSIAAVLAGSGALTKTGAGTVTLLATNTYTGATTVSNGTLAVAATGSISNSPQITVVAGATLDVSAVGSYAVNSNRTLMTDGAVLLPGSLTVAVGGTLGGGGSVNKAVNNSGTIVATITNVNGGASGSAYLSVNGAVTLQAGSQLSIADPNGYLNTSSGPYTVLYASGGVTPDGFSGINVRGWTIKYQGNTVIIKRGYPGTLIKIE